MPTTARDEKPPVEPPPTEALGDLAAQSLTPPPADRKLRADPRDAAPSARCGGDTEAELLGVMSRQLLDPDAARDAWDELYRRHARYVFTVAARSLGTPFRDADAVFDVVNDTFQAVFDWAGRQAPAGDVAARFHAPDPDVVRRRVLGWLSVIAGRLARDRLLAKNRGPREILDSEMDARPAEHEDAEPPPSRTRALLASALEKLTPDELEALRASLPWYDPSTGEFAFPRGEAARVAASLGIAPDALRQRRHRSLKRLEALLRDEPGA